MWITGRKPREPLLRRSRDTITVRQVKRLYYLYLQGCSCYSSWDRVKPVTTII